MPSIQTKNKLFLFGTLEARLEIAQPLQSFEKSILQFELVFDAAVFNRPANETLNKNCDK